MKALKLFPLSDGKLRATDFLYLAIPATFTSIKSILVLEEI